MHSTESIECIFAVRFHGYCPACKAFKSPDIYAFFIYLACRECNEQNLNGSITEDKDDHEDDEEAEDQLQVRGDV